MEQLQNDNITRQKPRWKEPQRYKVLLHNDDFTTMDFVVRLLKTVFRKNETQAKAIMLAVHRQGRGTAGIYPYDIALSKTEKGIRMARGEGFPLKLTCEPE